MHRLADELMINDLDEGSLLERIFPRLGPANVPVGPGDDAAVIDAPDARTVISIDTLVQDQDFRLEWPSGYRTTGYDVGWKSVAQNLSDINAMGAVPTALVISLTLPGSTPVAWVEDLADGVAEAIRTLGADRCCVVGGDLGRGDALVVTAAVTGDLEGRRPVLRSGAHPGDIVAVAGTLGQAAAGLSLLDSTHFMAEARDGLQALANIQSRPEPPLHAGPAAAKAGATAMMDISDGLLRDAARLARASSVSVDLFAAALQGFVEPLGEAADLLGADPMEWVLGGGEDHGLLCTFPAVEALPDGFVAVGTVRESGSARATLDGAAVQAIGWDHFGG